jgi:hypothetical protein
MEPVGSVDNSEDRNRIAGLACVGTGPGISRIEGHPAGIADWDQEPFEATTDHHLGSSQAIDNETTHSVTAKIHRDPDRINHAASTQVCALSTDLLLRHTHLQRVAFSLPVYRFGGVRC